MPKYQKVLVQEAGASLFTIAKDVKLQVEFNPATVAEYRLVGYETRALKREDFNNDAVDAGDVLVAVRDSGPGLSPATLEHLFEAFYTSKPSGLGWWASANETRGCWTANGMAGERQRTLGRGP